MYLESFQLRQASKEEIDSFEKLSWWNSDWYLVASLDNYYLMGREAVPFSTHENASHAHILNLGGLELLREKTSYKFTLKHKSEFLCG